MQCFRPLLLVTLSLILLCAGAACVRRNSTPARFYLLQPTTTGSDAVTARATPVQALIGLGPIQFPEYLDRPQMVTAVSPHQLTLNEFERWAEPLKVNFAHVLAENLSFWMPAAQVLNFPWRSTVALDYQVTVDVSSFHAGPGEEVQLQAKWTILKNRRPLLHRNSRIVMPLQGSGYEARVSAQGKAVAMLSREIADAISTIHGPQAAMETTVPAASQTQTGD
jgi:uncharacterized lipoprotein YmbA